MSNILYSIYDKAKTQPNLLAVTDGKKSMIYDELADAIAQMSKKLATYKGKCVAIDMNNSIEWVIIDLACINLGVTTLPLPSFFTNEQRNNAMKNAGAQCIISQGVEITPLQYKPVTLPENTAKITYTSGTTGNPKGVCLSQKNMEQVAQSLIQAIGKDAAKHTAAILPLAILLENIAGCYATLLSGGCYDIRPQTEIGFTQGMIPDFIKLINYLRKSKATSCIMVPEILRIVMQVIEETKISLPEMQFIAVGGSKVAPQLLQQAQQLGLPVYQGYGLSECASVVSVNTPDNNHIASVGKLLPHIDIDIAEDGEILIHNPAFLGYVGDKSAQETYATGDIGKLDKNNQLHITGRKKNVLITSLGRNISPEWPESILLAQPEIFQTLIVGDGHINLTALIVPSSSHITTAKLDEVIDKVNDTLPEYAQISQWHMVEPFTVPAGLLTGTGRPKRDAIIDIYSKLIDDVLEEKKYANIL